MDFQTFMCYRSLSARKGPCGSTMTIHRYIENSFEPPREIDIAPSTLYDTPQHFNFFPIGTAHAWALLVVVQHAESQISGGGFDK